MAVDLVLAIDLGQNATEKVDLELNTSSAVPCLQLSLRSFTPCFQCMIVRNCVLLSMSILPVSRLTATAHSLPCNCTHEI